MKTIISKILNIRKKFLTSLLIFIIYYICKETYDNCWVHCYEFHSCYLLLKI